MEIMLKNVRPSYPHLFEKDRYENFSCTLVLEGDNRKKVEAAIKKLMTENNVTQEKLKNVPLKASSQVEGAADLKTSDKKNRPFVLNAKRDIIHEEEDSPIYPGCLANAKISLYYVDGQYGKFIKAKLIAIQYAGDAEPFGGNVTTPQTAVAGFDEVDEAVDFLA